MSTTSPRAARIALSLLIAVNVFNFVDRQIVAILAERIKADLGLGDAELGFLYGTAFAVFYAVFGIPFGRLADAWQRRKLIGLGLGAWSLLTAASGLARSFVPFAAARIGVGIGEATASPAAYSMLSDLFPAARRATVLALYSGGIYIGAGLGMALGGLIVDRWDAAYALTPAPFGLRGWQVAYFAVGLPGVLLALAVWALPEPARGGAAEAAPAEPARPLRDFVSELAAVVPPLPVFHLAGLGGRAAALRNVATAVAIAVTVAALIAVTGTASQWIALGVGIYALASWSQALAIREPELSRLTFGSPTFRMVTLSFSLLCFTNYATAFWTAPFFVRVHGAAEGTVGLVLGGTAAAVGWLGVTLGGVIGDRLRLSSPAGRLYVLLAATVIPIPLGLVAFSIESTAWALALNAPMVLTNSMALGPSASTVQDLVPPRMRATAAAIFLCGPTFLGMALGPYAVGFASSQLGSLRLAVLLSFAGSLVGAVLAWRAIANLRSESVATS